MEHYSRRKFISTTLKATVFMAALNPVKQVLASIKNESKLPSWRELVDYARWCPSVHNLQPHKLKILSSSIAELYYEPGRLLPIGDPNSIFATVAMGIFVEHLSIAASFHGAKVTIEQIVNPIQTNASKLTLFAILELSPNNQKEELNRELILKRRTSRINYNGQALQQDALTKINHESQKFEHTFFSTSNKELIDEIIKLNEETLFEDLSSATNRIELDRLFRYTKEEAQTKKDGLWAKCMGFKGALMKSVFQHHEKWQRLWRKRILKNYYLSSFKGTATLCWFSGKFENTQDWLNAGIMLARVWLLITKEGAYIQPFGSLITNASAYKQINEKFEGPGNGKKIWMIFRAGYSKVPTRSFRLNTDEIIIN